MFLDNLVVIHEDNKIIIPIADIDVLLLNNYKLTITIQLMNALAKANVLTILCNNKYLPQSYILPIIGNWNTLKVLETQLNWNNIYRAKIWKEIIKLKINNQIIILKDVIKNESYKELILLIDNLKDFDISNREGHASKIYWHNLFGKNFKRHNDDYYNKLLDYGYTILRGYVTRSIVKKGLDPRISIFHKSFHNYFALASDLMEPFRILIDYEVYKIYQSKEINFYKHKDILIQTFNKKIFIDEKKYFINNAIDKFVDAIVGQTKLPIINLDYESI